MGASQHSRGLRKACYRTHNSEGWLQGSEGPEACGPVLRAPRSSTITTRLP